MSYTVNLQQRLQQLKKAQADLPGILTKVSKDATIRAVEAAAAATPPKEGTGRGPYIGKNTVTGKLQESWWEKSETTPKVEGSVYKTKLVNVMEYASYVNDGHRMNRHFVPHLYISSESGLLEYDPAKDVGIVVGTKTQYVKGEFMVDKAKEAYEKTVLAELDKKIQELMR